MTRYLVNLGVLFAIFLITNSAMGQVCVGTPVVDSQKMIGGRVLLFDGGTTFGPMGGVNISGPLSFDANVDLIDPDAEGADMGLGLEGRGIYEIPDLNVPICPVAGVSFTTIENSDAFGIMVGASIGNEMALSSDADLILHALPQLVVTRVSRDFDINGFEDSDSETNSDFVLELGGTVVGERLFGTLLILLADEEAFGFRIGFVY